MNPVKNLIQAFSAGASELDDVVSALNQQGFRCESGDEWTSASFTDKILFIERWFFITCLPNQQFRLTWNLNIVDTCFGV
jgi:hypothetical protein